MIRFFPWMIVGCLALMGCGRRSAESPATAFSPEESSTPRNTIQQGIENFTGKTAVDNLQRTREKINAIGAAKTEERRDLDLTP